ncbi:PEP-CTERM sorting domain-containing protein [Massilia atriviolacea]|uniref:PEP-CTERM sorting domain-containing protein n=1 Tax=Massilia atriviolacea TaxID=2495579 RepID=A0A430HHZ2_9BURK|nr:NF038129 family PEP-CTERM protein [Massilia atriviolacea]RSZ57132.1 PEP-CTERM sorting domain-containing protein [Massilia atriviolacea]
MFNFRTFVKQALLAATLAFGIGNASAGPTYHVDINTSQFSGLGSVDFVMSGFFGASGAIATVSNFTGALGEEFDRSGSVVGALPASVSLANTMMFNSVSHDLTLGGMFGFDVSFSGDFLTVPGFGSTFSVSMYDALGDYLTQSVSVVEFSLIPYSVDNDAAVRYTTDSIVRVAVPEPSDLLLVLTGLGLVAFVRRRATRAAR